MSAGSDVLQETGQSINLWADQIFEIILEEKIMTLDLSNKKNVRIGKNVHIEADNIEIGDGVLIKDNVLLEGPSISIGDYTTIRENTQIIGKSPCSIGMNCWIGQGCIIDATDNMNIGNGVGIGAHSQLWTHIRFGDVLQGCNWHNTKPMLIDDDVWFVGHCLVSPIHAQSKSMAMLGSVITKDMQENHIYAGTPAKDVTEKLGKQYRPITTDEKYNILLEKLENFSQKHAVNKKIQIVKEWPEDMDTEVSYFNAATREYTKRLSDIEMDFMLYLLVPIKFYPVGYKD